MRLRLPSACRHPQPWLPLMLCLLSCTVSPVAPAMAGESPSATPAPTNQATTDVRLLWKTTRVPLLETDWTPSWRKYQQPHAIWLDAHKSVAENLGVLEWTLAVAQKRRQLPELVVYMIPERDLRQSSAGGYAEWESYHEANELIATRLRRFVDETGLHPRIYLEPDSIGGMVELLEGEAKLEGSPHQAMIQKRLDGLRRLVALYREAGCLSYLDAGNSGWINGKEERLQWMARLLKLSGAEMADGITTNISNRFPILSPGHQWPEVLTERHYAQRLLTLLALPHLDVISDVSRNGSRQEARRNRQYYLSPDGRIYDNEIRAGRWVGVWRDSVAHPVGVSPEPELTLIPFFGSPKRLSQLINDERYAWDATQRLLTAPEWLDPVINEKPGAKPLDFVPEKIKPITATRWIKPPDACDGALNCPPGWSKSEIWEHVRKIQPSTFATPPQVPWRS